MSAAHKYLLKIQNVVSNKHSTYDCAWEGVRVEDSVEEWEMEAVWDLLGQDIKASAESFHKAEQGTAAKAKPGKQLPGPQVGRTELSFDFSRCLLAYDCA